LYGVYFDQVRSDLFIITELGGKTLSSKLTESPNLGLVQKLKILLDVSMGMKHLHNSNPCILHLDLKAMNILVDGSEKQPTAKLCDFGLAVELHPGLEYILPGLHGTIQWMAPEVLRDDEIELSKGFDRSVDVYSFAMVMYEVCHHKIPWQGQTFKYTDSGLQELDQAGAIRRAVLHGQRPAITATSVPDEYLQLMQECWSQDSETRPSFMDDPARLNISQRLDEMIAKLKS